MIDLLLRIQILAMIQLMTTITEEAKKTGIYLRIKEDRQDPDLHQDIGIGMSVIGIDQFQEKSTVIII